METELNSLRMRAERSGYHISGAERLVEMADLEAAAAELFQRALQHPRGQAEHICLTVEPVPVKQLFSGSLPDLHNNRVATWPQGRELAQQLLEASGVSSQAVTLAMTTLAHGAAPDGNSMRGAMLIDAETGERLEADRARGVRVSRMDLSPAAREQLRRALVAQALDNPHVVEALTLAAKVIAAPGVVAELCWSDDPDYVAGYVASPQLGYQRINRLKAEGEERGGRAFFLRRSEIDMSELLDWLEKTPLLIERIGRIHPPRMGEADA